MKNNLILVLLSSYNGEKYIEDQIISIMNQNQFVDLLIRDDGSKDNTVAIIKKLQKKYHDRIKLIEGTNIGYIKSFFELIKIAQGYKYYSLSDQDDVWLPRKLDTAIEWLEKENQNIPLLYASSSYLVHDNLVPYGTTQKMITHLTFYNTIIQNFLPGHNQVMNQMLLNELKKDIDYSKIYVHDSWITNVAIIKGKVLFNNESFVYYRQHQSNEVGFGKGKIGWFKERIKRIKNKDNLKYAIQINEFYKTYKSYLNKDYLTELEFFIESNKTLLDRFKFICTTKLYRQSKMQTMLFKILYLTGGYKIN